MNWFRSKIDEHKVRRFVIKTRLVINAHLTGPCFMFFIFFSLLRYIQTLEKVFIVQRN